MASNNLRRLSGGWRLYEDNTRQLNFHNLVDTFMNLNTAMRQKRVLFKRDAEKAKNGIKEQTKYLSSYIKYLKNMIDRNKKGDISQEDLKRLDKIYEAFISAEEPLRYDPEYNYVMTPSLKALNDIYKRITGKYLLKGRTVEHPFWSIRDSIKKIQSYRDEYKEAIQQKSIGKFETTDFLTNSGKIDAGRATPYWSNKEEMLARAFSSMIEDTLAEKGYASNFLSFGSDNGLIGFGKAYPEGEERKEINKAFQKFFGAYKNFVENTMPKPEELSDNVGVQEQENEPAVPEETVNKAMDDLKAEMQDVINEILVQHGISNRDTSQRETTTQTTPAEVEETEQEPETNSEETVTSENEAGNEPENERKKVKKTMWITKKDYLEFLKERHPKDYQEMKKDGTLDQFVAERIEKAKEYYVDQRCLYLDNHPNSSPLFEENLKNQMAADQYAREMTNAMMFEQE